MGSKGSKWSVCDNVYYANEDSLCLLVGVFGEVHHKGYSYVHCVTIASGSHLHLHVQKLTASFFWSFGVEHPESGHLFCVTVCILLTGIKNRHVTILS